MTEREKLIQKLKYLISVHEVKQKEYRNQNNLSSEYGCITKEATIMTSLLPRMQQLGVTLDDYKS